MVLIKQNGLLLMMTSEKALHINITENRGSSSCFLHHISFTCCRHLGKDPALEAPMTQPCSFDMNLSTHIGVFVSQQLSISSSH